MGRRDGEPHQDRSAEQPPGDSQQNNYRKGKGKGKGRGRWSNTAPPTEEDFNRGEGAEQRRAEERRRAGVRTELPEAELAKRNLERILEGKFLTLEVGFTLSDKGVKAAY